MSFADPVTLGFSVLGGAMSVLGGFSQSSAYKAQASEYMQQAQLAELQAKQDEANRFSNLNRQLGANRAAAAAMNVAVDSPSTQAIAEADTAEVARQIGLTRVGAQAEVSRLQTAAAQDMSASTSAILSGFIKGGSGIFGGISDYNRTHP